MNPLVMDKILFTLKFLFALITRKVLLTTVNKAVPLQLSDSAERALTLYAPEFVGVMHYDSVTVPVCRISKYHVTLCALDIKRFLFMSNHNMLSELCLMLEKFSTLFTWHSRPLVGSSQMLFLCLWGCK